MQNAIESGRLRASVVRNSKGHLKIGDVRTADREWAANTRRTKRRGLRRRFTEALASENGVDDFADNEVPEIRGDMSSAELDAIIAIWKAKMSRLQYRVKTGELVEGEAVRRSAFNTARVIRDNLLNIADRVAARLAAEKDPMVCHAVLDAELRQSLETLETPQ
ncbi:hypothetical protein FHS85_005165 [Rhodoligotrophos appendicifer]|uniref:hypothetical protein n=1 Tax=Rhodoligotrophos appendicifer TaxID=987056 RepID=UPI001185638E|nr:hypothetical protein [Rhodoligotrophos appendicifer]